jgi:hypothetical protein
MNADENQVQIEPQMNADKIKGESSRRWTPIKPNQPRKHTEAHGNKYADPLILDPEFCF